MKRNTYGQGSVRERRPGQWEARYRAADGRVRPDTAPAEAPSKPGGVPVGAP